MTSPAPMPDRRSNHRRRSDGAHLHVVDEFLHDVTQEVATLRVMVDRMRTRAAGRPEAVTVADQMDDELDWLEAVLRGTLAPSSPIPFSPAELVLDVVSSLRPAHANLKCSATSTARVFMDPLKLTRAVRNLIDNALRAAGPKSRVRVSVRRADSVILVAVEDDGPGFGRGPAGTAGIGLAAARRIAAEAGGALVITTDRSVGTEVCLQLPVITSPHSPKVLCDD